MNAFHWVLEAVHTALAELQSEGVLPADIDTSKVNVEPPRDAQNGDAATNAALVMAKPARMKPMMIAEPLAAILQKLPGVETATAAPPGFVNLRLTPGFWQRQIGYVLQAGLAYGNCAIGAGEPVNVEYCSVNPTGPLHAGHGRGTVVGDALANLLERAGYDVTREYYINDGGAQIEALARSIYHRYLEELGVVSGPPGEGLYPLEELIPVGVMIAKRDGDRWVDEPEKTWLDEFGRAGVDSMMVRIKEDLGELGVQFDVFTSERSLIESGKVDAALEHLDKLDLIYTGTLPPPKGKPIEDWEPKPQLLFRATDFGDDIDRPLKRSSGHWTYFAADLAYHFDKHRRGASKLIDIWGADHGGYVRRMQAAVKALSQEKAEFSVLLCQLVNLLDGGVLLRMSKRAGRIVTLRDVVREVGRDVLRFIMLTRKNDAPLDFDLKKVVEQSKDNPVFYVQYAHARICSVFRNAAEAGMTVSDERLLQAPVVHLSDDAEIALIRRVAQFPRVVESAARHLEPHRIAFFLSDLASEFHALWALGRERTELRFIQPDKPEQTEARLAMLASVRYVLGSGLGIIGVKPVEEMH